MSKPVDNEQELLELLMTIRTTREVEHNDNQWTTEFVYSIEEAKARLLQWGTRQVIKELQNQRIRFEVPEEELGINGYPRPGAAGRNALKRKELHYLDKKIAELQASLKDGGNDE